MAVIIIVLPNCQIRDFFDCWVDLSSSSLSLPPEIESCRLASFQFRCSKREERNPSSDLQVPGSNPTALTNLVRGSNRGRRKLKKALMVDKTTMYGTVPTSSSAPVGYFARARETGRELYAQRRPWRELFDRHGFSKPENFQDAMGRIRRNLSYFRVNYAMIILGIVFLSLLWHPISLIVFIIMFVAWGFLYFFRDEPLVVFGRTFSDGFVLCVLAVITFVALMLTHATLPFLIGLLIAVVIVMFHAAFKSPENYYVDEEESAAGGLLSVVDSPGPPSAPRV